LQRLTSSLEDRSYKLFAVEGHRNDGKPYHDGQMKCPSEALDDTILAEPSVKNGGYEPCNPEESAKSEIRLLRQHSCVVTAAYKKKPQKDSRVWESVISCTEAKTVRLATKNKS
jgi:hypothetical protein